MASSEGIGARVAWARMSAQVLGDLATLLSPYPVKRLEFEEAGRSLQQILEEYRCAQVRGDLLLERFDSAAPFAQALTLSLEGLDPAACVTVLLQDAQAKGVYRTSVEAIKQKALDLLRFDGDSIVLAVDDVERGYLLDREVTNSGDEVLELELWGLPCPFNTARRT